MLFAKLYNITVISVAILISADGYRNAYLHYGDQESVFDAWCIPELLNCMLVAGSAHTVYASIINSSICDWANDNQPNYN